MDELTLQFTSQPLLPYADDGEGADQANGSRPSAVAATEVSPGMSYSINATLLTISDPSISGRFCESSVSCRRGSGSWLEKVRLIAKGLYESDTEDEE